MIIVNPQFDLVGGFDGSNVAVVNDGDFSGIINEQGEWIVPLQSRYFIHGLPGWKTW